MRRLLLVVALALVLAAGARAAVPQPDARAFYVVNGATGEVLASRHADEPVPIASITKLMTVIVALEHLKPSDVVTVTGSAAAVGESRIPLYRGQRISVHDLLAGALIQSANDAADALAAGAAGAAGGNVTTFVGWMNAKARALGLRDTHFTRPDGLDAPGHVSSAHDVAILARVAMRSAVVRSLVRLRSAPIEGGRFVVHTWNDLLGVFPGVIGVKTGHTSAAGWCEVAAVRRGSYTIYAVILGSPNRAQRNADLAALLGWGVAQYQTLHLIRAQPYAWASVPYGRAPVALVATKPLVSVIRVGQSVTAKIVAPTTVSLPVVRGERLGRVELWEAGKLIGQRPLVAGRSISRPGFGGRLSWYSSRTMHHLLGFLP